MLRLDLSIWRLRFNSYRVLVESNDTRIKSFNVDYDEIFDGYKGEFKEAKYSADQINVELIHKSINFEEFQIYYFRLFIFTR